MKKQFYKYAGSSILGLAGMALAMSSPLAKAQTATWTGTNSAWTTPSNWSTGAVPDGNTDVLINPASTNFVYAWGATMNAKNVDVTPGAGSSGIHMSDTQTLNMNSLVLGNATASASVFSALIYDSVGTVNVATNITLAAGAGGGQILFIAPGALNIGGGSGSIVNGGGAGSASIDVRALGVSINAASVGVDTLRLGNGNTSASFSINSGQTYTSGDVQVGTGTAGTQTLNMNGGTLTASTLLSNVGSTGNNAVVNLNGGTINATLIQRYQEGNSQAFNWNDGTIANISSGNLTLNKSLGTSNLVISLAGTGTHTFDISSGKTATVASTAILADKSGEHGTLNKAGTGTLTISSVSTYTGATTISTGTLVIGSTGSIAGSSEINLVAGSTLNVSAVSGFTLASGQSLKGSGTVVGALTVGSGATLAIGNSPGTMTFSNGLSLASGSTNDFEINGLTAGLYDLAQGGAGSQTVTFNGTLNLVFQSGFNTEGTVKIFDFESYVGNFSMVNISGLAGGYSASFDSLAGVVSVVPEPSTWALLAGGLTVTMALRRRRVNAQKN